MASHETPTRLPRNRASRQNTAVVLLAVGVLAAVGAAFGYVLGTQANADDNRGAQPRVSQSTTKAASPTARTGKPCPAITERAAKDAGSPGDLRQRLYIKTDQSEVWICEDRAAKLWYQGHRLAGPFNQATGSDSLFLTTVNLNSDGGYLAVNITERGRTDYAVYKDRLVITNRENGRSETQRAIQTD